MTSSTDPKPAVYAFKGGVEGAMERLEAQLSDKLRAEVADDLKTIDEAIAEGKEKLAALEAWKAETEEEKRKTTVPGSAEGYNFGRVASAVMAGGQEHHYKRYAPSEWEASEAYASATTPDAAGGFWIPGEVRDDLMIELVRPRSVVLQLGAQQMAFTSTPVEIPREQAPALAPGDESENSTIGTQDIVAGQLTMNPRLTGLIVKGSRRFFEMGASADPFIRRILAREMQIKIDSWALRGTGGIQPIGILNAPGVTGVDFGSVAATDHEVYELLVEMQSSPLEVGSHEVLESPGWAFAAKVERALRLIKSQNDAAATDNLELNRRVLSDSREDRVLGEPFRATTLLLSTADPAEVIYGDWLEMVIGTWRGMQIESTEVGGSSFEDHQRWLKVTQEVDVGIWHPTAFSICSANWDLSAF